jgi:hypothetical protein
MKRMLAVLTSLAACSAIAALAWNCGVVRRNRHFTEPISVPDELADKEPKPPDGPPPLPTLRVEPRAELFPSGANDVAVFPPGSHVVVAVTIHNLASDTLVVNKTLEAFPGPVRPETALRFEITAEDGSTVPMAHAHFGTRVLYAPGELLILPSGSFHGWYVLLDCYAWEHNLPPGRYSLRARLQNYVRSFFDRNPRALKEWLSLFHNPTEAMSYLRDFTIESNEVSLEVQGTRTCP